ncbi:MAG: C40 family peptidase [Bacteroidales bacterium]|nr:C40 family peptidase [Bacteroidales bacterium]
MEKPASNTGVSLQGFIPVRKEPRERAEMVTQVLFGEFVDVMDDEGKWLYIRCLDDQYEGWIDRLCIDITGNIPEKQYIVVKENTRVTNATTGSKVTIPIGASIPEINNGRFTLADNSFHVEQMDALCEPGSAELTEVFKGLVSIPYLWGGRCGFGFDCSGLTQFLCRIAGSEIPRDAGEQSAIGKTLSFINEARPGDLAFFDNTEGMIHHVGMITANNQIIHASGMVRIDKFDQQGIYNEKLNRYTHKLRVLKRVL